MSLITSNFFIFFLIFGVRILYLSQFELTLSQASDRAGPGRSTQALFAQTGPLNAFDWRS